jgi:SAM-dependent methyltransferase
VLYDLGCGDGRIVITAAKELGCRGVGIDIDPQRIKESQKNAVDAGVSDKVKFLQMDLFEADFKDATVVTLYLLSKVNLRLRPILLRDLKPGTRVVSHDFSMGDWASDNSTIINEKFEYVPLQDTRNIDDYWDKHTVYLWIIPANVTGVWKWALPKISGDKIYSLEIEQEFQEIKGNAFEGSSPVPFHSKNGKIQGDKLEFTLEKKVRGATDRLIFEGIVNDHTATGFVKIEGKPDFVEKWEATRDSATRRPIDK